MTNPNKPHHEAPVRGSTKILYTSSAKVSRPQLASVYPRPRLFETLKNAREHHRIVWVAGPPGAGKTTLVNSYIETGSESSLWYEIDSGDNDIASFFHYFEQAVQAALPRKRKPLPQLTPEHLPTISIFARRYFQEVFTRFPHGSVWILDNYHELSADSPLHSLLLEGLGALPLSVNVIVTSRNDPPPQLARLSVHNQLLLLDAQALKLTTEEVAGLAEKLVHKMPGADIQHLNKQADGWIAGVVLLLSHNSKASLPDQPVPSALFDYFAGEVFHHMDPKSQRILRISALLPTMTPASVDQLVGEEGSETVLADLARRSYFTVRNIQAGATYQYHTLFRTFLLREADAVYTPEQLVQLRRKAAALLEAEGRIEEAIVLLHEATAWDELARLIMTVAPVLATQARLQTLAKWISLLPVINLNQHAWLLYWLAQCRMMINPIEARADLEKAFAKFDQAGDPAGLYLSWAGVVYTYAIGWQDLHPLDHWLEVFEGIESRFPQIPSPAITANVTSSMLVALTHRQPRHPNAERWTNLATEMINTPGNSEYRVMIAAYLGIYYTWSGPFKRAGELIPLVRPLLSADLSPTIQIFWQCFVGMHASARTAEMECLTAAKEARSIAQDSGAYAMDNLIGIINIHACLISGNVRAAESWVTSTDALHKNGQIDYAVYYHGLSMIAMHKGEYALAAEHANKSLNMANQYGNALPEGVACVGMAQALFELGQPEQAREFLALGKDVVKRTNSELLEYLCWFGQASDAICYGGEVAWIEPLNALLAREKTTGGMGVPLWPLSRVAQIYTFALDQGIEVEYAQSVIRKRKLMPDKPPLDVENWPWSYRIYTLGRFSIVKDGKPMVISGNSHKKPLELLKTLIALGGREIWVLQIIEKLWPDADGDAAQQAFDTTLHRLRKFFGDDSPLMLKDGRLSLDERKCWVDCWAFERLLFNIESKLESASTDEIRFLSQKVLKLYRGPFMGNDASIPAAVSRHEKLRSRFVRAIRQLGNHYETCAALEEAIECYLRALEAEPLAEEFYHKLMQGYHALGRRAEALVVYERCKKTLHAMLDIAPSREIELLKELLLLQTDANMQLKRH